jgi:hypothetical protein
MKRTTSLILTGIVAFTITSCRKKGCTDETAINYDEKAKKDDGSCEYDDSYTVPTTYSFSDENGNSTVSFTGQQQRLDMLSEMTVYMKTGNTQGTQLDANQLKNMYANSGYTWTDANGLGMTGSSKQLENKTAGGDQFFIDQYKAYMDSIEAVSASSSAGSMGVAGVVTSTGDPSKMYLQSATGQEYTQIIEKGLMGAVFFYNISSYYLSDSKMNVDNSTAVDPANGNYYTVMEHHWDEAYGYFTSEINYPSYGTDRFWGKYADGREDLLGSATKIVEAFRLGRAAIANDDMETRDAQRAIIRLEMEKMIAGTAIHYINSALSNVTDDALRNHALSEAWAFIDDLRYGHNPMISTAEITAVLNLIGDDFYAVSTTDLNAAKDQLSTIYGMDAIKDNL